MSIHHCGHVRCNCPAREEDGDVSDELPTFKKAWAEKRAEGYRYGKDALEQVHMGWEMAFEAITTAGLALVPAADVPTPISDETLRHLRECALAWEPEARVIGDVTAHQLRAFCLELAKLRRENPDPECDNCGAVIDGNQAATSDVCHDCWRSARERAHKAEAALSSARELLVAWLGWKRGKVGKLPLVTHTRAWLRANPDQ